MAIYGCEPGKLASYQGATFTHLQCPDTADKMAENFSPKVDPSYKSKRYRDKLRSEIRDLENLLPVERSSMQRKLDSQTVFRLAIAYFRTKLFIKAAGLSSSAGGGRWQARLGGESPSASACLNSEMLERIEGSQLLQVLDGFLLVVTSDGTVLYVSENIAHSLGFTQVELLERCIYGIVHPDDHHELKMVLEHTLDSSSIVLNNQRPCCGAQQGERPMCKSVSFLTRIKCFSGATTGYLKMHCTGHMRSLPNAVRSPHCSGQVLFALCRPFVLVSTDPTTNARNCGFWSKHSLDLKFRHMDDKIADTLGYSVEELEGTSFYGLIHPEDLSVFSSCHRTLIHTEEIQTMYFRVECKDSRWIWLHTRGKVVFKNSKKYSIVFTHCPVREEDSTYIQQEMALRRAYAIPDLMTQGVAASYSDGSYLGFESHYRAHVAQSARGTHPPAAETLALDDNVASCPSSWHTKRDCQSPIELNGLSHCREPVPKLPRSHDQNHPAPGIRPHHGQVPSFEQAGTEYSCRLSQQIAQARENTRLTCDFAPPPSVARFGTRQYLMQLNGVGMVTPQNVAKTLVFQGQLTAIETQIPPIWSPPLWSEPYFDYQQSGPSMNFCRPFHAQGAQPAASFLESSPVGQQTQCQYGGCDVRTYIKQEAFSCQRHVPGESGDVQEPAGRLPELAACQERDVMSLPSCAYQTARSQSEYALVKDKLVPRALRGKAELPNIGSFLEYMP